jgi:hypothetical protein
MNENTCKICNQQFDNEQQLREHEKTSHSTGKKEQDRPSGERPKQQPGAERIAS